MQSGQYVCRVEKNSPIGENIRELRFICPEIARLAWPGQFLHIKCGDKNILRRPISICRVSGDFVHIVFEVKGEGTKSLALLRKGDVIDVLGPLGKGFPKELRQEKIVVVGGGAGAAPMLFCAEVYRADAVIGFKTREAMILAQDFFAACENRIFICTEDGSYGYEGLVTGPLEKILQLKKRSAVFACGPKPMLKAVCALSGQYKVPCYVSLEERMGCGVGACLTCACKVSSNEGADYLRVCRDGPVFRSDEVIFDD